MAAKPVWTATRIEQLCALVAAGGTTQEAAARFGCTIAAIRNVSYRHGIRWRRPRQPPEPRPARVLPPLRAEAVASARAAAQAALAREIAAARAEIAAGTSPPFRGGGLAEF